MDIVNLGIPGAGNSHISKSIILHIERNQLDPKETLVIPMWSGIARIDWIADRVLSNFKDTYPFTYNYDQHNELIVGGSWWHRENNKTHIIKTLIEYSKYQTTHSLALDSWLSMTSLINYLDAKEFKHYHTSILNHGFDQEEKWIDYDKELAELNLSLDKTNWISPCIGNYCKELGMLQDDNFHPTMQGHEKWTREVLIPYLTEHEVLCWPQ